MPRRFLVVFIAFLLLAVFSFGQAAPRLTTLYSFGSFPDQGIDPQAGVVFDKTGNLYGTTSVGGISGNGILFELSPPAVAGDLWTVNVLHSFHGSPDGKVPESRLIVASTGKLFGTTLQGGANDMGTAFASLPPASPGALRTGKVIYSFGNFPGDGVNPNAGLLAAHQSLYGVTFGGGATGRGTVFQLTPPADPTGAWTETILYSFTGSGDAAFPSSDLVMDESGNLYGTTTLGGANNLGAVFELSPPAVAGDPWIETVVHSFNGTDGTLPAGRLQFDASGALYGTTDGGGTNQEGTVFKLAPPAGPGGSWTETVLYNFSGGIDGGNPQAGVTMDKKGRLYGAASTGGSGGPDFGGVVFVLDPPADVGGAWTETVLHSFGGPDGFRPISPLVLRKGGIYGTTAQGGLFGRGTAFVLMP